jgi:hypothetical protein
MKSLSFWAKRNPVKARVIIVLLHVLLIALALNTGIELYKSGISLPVSLLYVITILFFVVALLYPSKRKKDSRFTRQQFYRVQKTCDFIIGACSFIMILGLANNYYNSDFQNAARAASSGLYKITDKKPTAEEILASLAYRNKSTLTHSEKRILKIAFRQQLKIYAKAKLQHDDEAAGKAVLIILSIIGAIGLLALLAGLACTLSCNGSEAGAILLAVLGTTAIIWLLVVVIRKISHHKKKESTAVPDTKNAN